MEIAFAEFVSRTPPSALDPACVVLMAEGWSAADRGAAQLSQCSCEGPHQWLWNLDSKERNPHSLGKVCLGVCFLYLNPAFISK